MAAEAEAKTPRPRTHLGAGVEACPTPIDRDGIVAAEALVELQALVSGRWVAAKPHPTHPEYVLYNYSSLMQAYGTWTPLAKLCRGLVLQHDPAGVVRVVARPLPKFFNLGMGAENDTLPPHTTFVIRGKVDGSLGIVFHVEALGGWVVNTRGSWQSAQAVTALAMLRELRMDGLDPALTYCFEIIYPDNRVVVNNGEDRALTLLYAADTRSGVEVGNTVDICNAVLCPIAPVWGSGCTGDMTPLELKAHVMAAVAPHHPAVVRGDEAEGFVLETTTHPVHRVKLKYDAYVALHRVMSGSVTDVTVWEALAPGGAGLPALLEVMPDELYGEVAVVEARLLASLETARAEVAALLATLPPGASRKDAAAVFKAAGVLGPPAFAAFGEGINSVGATERLWKRVKPCRPTPITGRPLGAHTTM